MESLYSKIVKLCRNKEISPARMCAELGFSKNFVSELKSGRAKSCSANRAKLIADYFGVGLEYLMSDSDKQPVTRIPVYGKVPAGIPLEAIEDISGYEEITPQMAAHGQYIALKISGDSMSPEIYSGDTVIIRLQPDAETGDTVIAMVNGNEATCKKIRKDSAGIWLLPNNPAFKPMFYSNEQIFDLPVRIIGTVVELRRSFSE